jgi:hypothetical protein
MSKSNTNNWNDMNPPPAGPLTISSINHKNAVVSTGSIMSAWPTSEYKTIISESVTIQFSRSPFNFIKTDTTGGAVTITLTEVSVGAMFMFQVLGTNGLTINVVFSTGTITVSAPITVVGTYIVVIFRDSVKYNTLENPIAS